MTITEFKLEMPIRARRNRISGAVRSLVQETHLLPEHLVPSFFIIEGINKRHPIPSMPGIERLSIDLLIQEIDALMQQGIKAVDLFAYIPHENRDLAGTLAYADNSLIQIAIRAVKTRFPDLCVMADIALDPYTSHGHDGIIDEAGNVLNDPSCHLLALMSLKAAEAGADFLAPSDMMDGRVGYIRRMLDEHGFEHVGILSYAAKYTSALYAPFRSALESAPKIGDKKNYQLNPANKKEAIREALLDQSEGADMLMIKPALPYLDVIAAIKEATLLPIAAYHVSGEYAMVMAAHEKGWLNADKVFYEQLLAIRRAGADFILTYAAKHVLKEMRV